MRTLRWYYGIDMASPAASRGVPPDRVLTFDKVTNVHFAGTAHDEDQPSHLLVHTEVCTSICGTEYGIPARASVPPTSTRSSATRAARRACRSTRRTACTARRATSWTLRRHHLGAAEGGGGPQYTGM
jgi:electron-transferring-flavoprotein dehydrogenase